MTIGYSGGKVSSITTAAGTTGYGYADASGVRTVTVTDPLSHATVYTFDIASQRMTSVTDALSHTTSYTYDASGRLTRVTAPEGNSVATSYDARGNVTETRAVAKSGSGVSDVVATASYDATCSNVVTCNQPNSTTDARGNTTDYSYDATHGGVTAVTLPAASGGAVRPQTRYAYTALQAYYDNGGGSILASGQAVYRLTSTSQCRTTSSCAGGADEVKATVDYGPQTAGTGNNLLPVSASQGAGDGSLTATTAIGYDDVGNVTSVDGPLPGSDDTTRFRYDADRERVGVISADPDGGGSLKRRAQRVTYNAHGIPVEAEIGTVNGTSDSDWAGFASLQQETTALDAADRKARQVVTAGGTTYSLTQYDYDAAGRLECTALRMNPATWGSLPGSACTLATAGAYGPDRIARTSYDAADRPTLVQTAYGTADQADEVTTTYTVNGKVATATDAEGNKTTYEYDGIDRLLKTRYPDTTAGAGTSSTTDYEQLGYDAGSNVTSRRVRDGQSIGYTYDNLGRLTSKDRPNVAWAEWDLTYAYDNLGRLTQAADSWPHTLTFAYDALGRETSEYDDWLGATYWQHDLAGRRTRMTWWDGFYVTYDHLVTGEVTAIRENGAGSGIGVLASYAYDDLGRRTSLTRGNGTVTSYGYDSGSELTALAQDLAGTSYDTTTTLAYTPAGQITSQTRTNDAYAWTGAANMNTATTVNGLNQATAVGAGSLAYDGRGNLTFSGGSSYTYGVDNLLATAPGGNFAYDALDRLFYATAPSSLYHYDGGEIIAEHDATTHALQRRYVFGPGSDEPLVWYEGTGTADRHWLHADERGSIVAVTNDSGAATAIDSYDEYGVPASGNVGRFQYTGQAYLPELGMYYYKARMYSSRLGRFLQTDPIGYGDGLNWYNYVGGDPVNWADPSGQRMRWACVQAEGYAPTCGYVDDGTGNGSSYLVGVTVINALMPVTRDLESPAREPQKPKPFTCADAMKEKGRITTSTINLSAVGALGLVGGAGTWRNESTGSHGNFQTIGFGAGLAAGGTYTMPTYTSIGAFTGMSDGFSIGASFGIAGGRLGLGIGYSKSWNSSGSGGGFAFDVGSAQIPSISLVGTYTDTQITGCQRGK